MIKLKIGDRVKFLNDIGGGIISGFQHNGMAKVLVDGFELPYPVKELISDADDESEKNIENKKEEVLENIEEQHEEEIPLIEKYKIAPHEAEVNQHKEINLEEKVKLKIGDRIKFLNGVGGGTITTFQQNGMAKVMVEEGFELPYPMNELIRDIDNESKAIAEMIESSVDTENKNEEVLEPLEEEYEEEIPLIEKYKVAPREAEVDMHIWRLTDNYPRMTNGEMLNLQLGFFKHCLESAIENNFTKVIFIHGVGNGRLKQEIRTILDEYVYIEYNNASMEKYGVGATKVLIRHNK